MFKHPLSEDDDHHLLETEMDLSSQHGDDGTSFQSVDHCQNTKKGIQKLISTLTDSVDLGPRFAAPHGTQIDIRRTMGTLDISFPVSTPFWQMYLLIIALFHLGFPAVTGVHFVRTGEYSLLLLCAPIFLIGFLLLGSFVDSFARTHVHINKKSYSISRSIWSGTFWASEQRGAFEHLSEAEFTRRTVNNNSSVLLNSITLHAGATQYTFEAQMCDLEAQWLKDEINSFLAELKGHPLVLVHNDNNPIPPPNTNSFSIEQGITMGVPVESLVPYGMPATMVPGGALALGMNAMVPPV